jgi:hypothetical protein
LSYAEYYKISVAVVEVSLQPVDRRLEEAPRRGCHRHAEGNHDLGMYGFILELRREHPIPREPRCCADRKLIGQIFVMLAPYLQSKLYALEVLAGIPLSLQVQPVTAIKTLVVFGRNQSIALYGLPPVLGHSRAVLDS